MDDLSGQKFATLIVIKRMNNNKYRQSMWLCRCNCGKEKVILGSSLRSGRTKSCGCLTKDVAIQIHTTHNHTKNGKASQTYAAWAHMIARCTNPNNRGFHNYGGRGITVCKRWMKFENFLKDMDEVPEGHQIDRINNSGNYCKSNCRWVTPKQNSRNKRNNLFITYGGKTQLLMEWAEETNINYNALRGRLRCGWSAERTLTEPVRKRKKIPV